MGGIIPGRIFPGVSFPGGIFPDLFITINLEYCPWLILYHLVDAENKLLELQKLDFEKHFFWKKVISKRLSMKAAIYEYNNTFPNFKNVNFLILR